MADSCRLRSGLCVWPPTRTIEQRGDEVHSLGWAAANLGFPFLGPIIVVKGVRLLIPTRHVDLRKRLRLTYLFRDGQYALTSLAVSTASFYEILEADGLNRDAKTWLVELGVLSAISIMLIVAGLLLESDDPEVAIPPGSGVLNWTTIHKWVQTYRIGTAVLVLVLPVSYVAYQVHESGHQSPKVGTQSADHHDTTASSPQESQP